MEIVFDKTICPILSIGKETLVYCIPNCAMIQTYNISKDETLSYCRFCRSNEVHDGRKY